MSSSRAGELPKVIPAQLDFLTIYNPSLGDTDETEYDQILFFYQKRERRKRHGSNATEEKEAARKHSHAGDHNNEELKNWRLRQVGLARGVVEFANNFSDGIPVDSIETDQSRIILKELEAGWWILASIDLTQLPAASKTQVKSDERKAEDGPSVEYSSREVSPAPLLLQQLEQAHSAFLLHHAQTLTELYNRLGRDLFCAVLERYWAKYCRGWDVLLHGNSIVDMCNATKLAGGGELGMGVGEEEWGSGEREVLEDFVRRTEGLRDLIVGRFGDAPIEKPRPTSENAKEKTSQSIPEPWLGLGNTPQASDGIIFGGTGYLARRSMATVSQWIEAIFRQGESAYGIKDNPTSRPRHKRGQARPDKINIGPAAEKGQNRFSDEAHPKTRSPANRVPNLRRQAIENAATPPGIPAPLVGSVERSLEQATANLQKLDANKASEDTEAVSEDPAQQVDESSYFDTETMTKWLKMGYGTSWTLNPKGFSKPMEPGEKPSGQVHEAPDDQAPSETPVSELQHVDPTPEISDTEEESKEPFVQRLEQSVGKFLIGLTGDLENAEFEADANDDERDGEDAPNSMRQTTPRRIFRRTLSIKLAEPEHDFARARSPDGMPGKNATGSAPTLFRQESGEPKTSAGASVDGPAPNVPSAKVRVIVYVHQPFIFVFLFDLHAPKLSMPAFYRNIHHQLGPLQKPLLRSTDPARISERISQLIGEDMAHSAGIHGLYDLLFDPAKLTVRTSIPSIPLPGSLAAEGFTRPSTQSPVSGSWYTLGIPIEINSNSRGPGPNLDNNGLALSDWTRIESLNVHTQLLNTWIDARKSGEVERSIKTSRGWWVVWLRGLGSPRSTVHSRDPSSDRSGRNERDRPEQKEAFLVRKAPDPVAKSGSAKAMGSAGRWFLREQRDVSRSSDAGGRGAAEETSTRGVVEGVGVDVRKWVDAIARLSQ